MDPTKARTKPVDVPDTQNKFHRGPTTNENYMGHQVTKDGSNPKIEARAKLDFHKDQFVNYMMSNLKSWDPQTSKLNPKTINHDIAEQFEKCLNSEGKLNKKEFMKGLDQIKQNYKDKPNTQQIIDKAKNYDQSKAKDFVPTKPDAPLKPTTNQPLKYEGTRKDFIDNLLQGSNWRYKENEPNGGLTKTNLAILQEFDKHYKNGKIDDPDSLTKSINQICEAARGSFPYAARLRVISFVENLKAPTPQKVLGKGPEGQFNKEQLKNEIKTYLRGFSTETTNIVLEIANKCITSKGEFDKDIYVKELNIIERKNPVIADAIAISPLGKAFDKVNT